MKTRIFLPLLVAGVLSVLAFAGLTGDLATALQAEDSQPASSWYRVTLTLPGGQGPDAAIDAQIGLADLLERLQRKGLLVSFIPYLGLNEIDVQGRPEIARLVSRLPGIESVELLPTGEPGELPQTAQDIQQPAATGQIIGTVSSAASGIPLSGFNVRAYRFDGLFWSNIGEATTAANGSYTISGLASSALYKVRFTDPAGNYANQYYNNRPSFSQADNITVIDGQTTSGINAAMQPAGRIQGSVKTKSNGSNLIDIVVGAYQQTNGVWTLMGSGLSNSTGNYLIDSLPIGSYKLLFSDPYEIPRVIDQYYFNHDLLELADTVSVVEGQITTLNPIQMGSYAKITGKVTGAGGAPNISNIQVDVWGQVLTQWTQEISGTTTTAANGTYTSNYLGTRNYRLRFTDPYGMYSTRFYDNDSAFDSALPVAVSLGYTTANINIELALNPAAPITQNFGTGWYLVGWPVTPANTAPSSVFAPIASTLDIVWDYDQCGSTEWTFYNPEIPGNTLTAIAPSEGYWVKHTGSASLTVQGQYSASTSISLCTGWNLIGYPAALPKPVKDVLAPISGKYTLVYGYDGSDTSSPWEKYDPAYSVGNDLTTFKPGRAYWINMNLDATLVIPGR